MAPWFPFLLFGEESKPDLFEARLQVPVHWWFGLAGGFEPQFLSRLSGNMVSACARVPSLLSLRQMWSFLGKAERVVFWFSFYYTLKREEDMMQLEFWLIQTYKQLEAD